MVKEDQQTQKRLLGFFLRGRRIDGIDFMQAVLVHLDRLALKPLLLGLIA
jgi:hypothetical protein